MLRLRVTGRSLLTQNRRTSASLPRSPARALTEVSEKRPVTVKSSFVSVLPLHVHCTCRSVVDLEVNDAQRFDVS